MERLERELKRVKEELSGVVSEREVLRLKVD
jgi:hypothetical protein